MAVYRWRVSCERKAELDRAARARSMRLSAFLDMIMRDWLATNGFVPLTKGGSKLAKRVARREYGR